MEELKVKNEEFVPELASICNEIEQFLASHPKRLNAKEREELGKLLDQRAASMSKVFGMKISSVNRK